MEILSLVATVLLSLAAYSGGSVTPTRGRSRSPEVVDLVVAVVCVTLAVLARGQWGHWMGALGGVSLGWIVGIVATILQSPAGRRAAGEEPTPAVDHGIVGRWKRFAIVLGNYQGRLFMGLLYFLVLVPFGVVSRLVADPLGLDPGSRTTWWTPRAAVPDSEVVRLRRQF